MLSIAYGNIRSCLTINLIIAKLSPLENEKNILLFIVCLFVCLFCFVLFVFLLYLLRSLLGIMTRRQSFIMT